MLKSFCWLYVLVLDVSLSMGLESWNMKCISNHVWNVYLVFEFKSYAIHHYYPFLLFLTIKLFTVSTEVINKLAFDSRNWWRHEFTNWRSFKTLLLMNHKSKLVRIFRNYIFSPIDSIYIKYAKKYVFFNVNFPSKAYTLFLLVS